MVVRSCGIPLGERREQSMGLNQTADANGARRGIAVPGRTSTDGRLLGAVPGFLRVDLLGGFRLSCQGETVTTSRGSEKLVALVAVLAPGRSPMERILVASTLWPDASERRAYATLRSALARLDACSRRVLDVGPLTLRLAERVAVDVHQRRALAHRLLDPSEPCSKADLSAASIAGLSVDLLPGWYDDWVVNAADDWRQLRLHALEALAAHLTDARRFGEATAAATAAVHADPLRESARRTLICVHLAEGNRSEAKREFDRFQALLRTEVGLEPTPQLRALAGSAEPRHAVVTRSRQGSPLLCPPGRP